MTSNRPYLLRAFYDWIIDNQLTPHLVVDALFPNTQVPQQHVKDGQIVLNISPSAVQDLLLGNDWISFSARFSGAPHAISFSPDAVLGIYARENGNGMLFEPVESASANTTDESPAVAPTTGKPSGKPSLKVIK